MKKLLIYTITLLLLTACAKKVVKCALVGETMNTQKLRSKITFNKNRIIADTIIVYVSGMIKGSYLNERDTITDALGFANFSMTDVKTGKVFGTVTEEDGSYHLTIPAGMYQLEVQFIGYNRVIVNDIQLGTGEIFNLSAHLGIGIDREYFEIQNHRATRELIRKTN